MTTLLIGLKHSIAPGVIATLYGLTPAESRLVVSLAGGRSLKEYADEAGITLNTARWTLKQGWPRRTAAARPNWCALF